MCVINTYIDVYPDGRRQSFAQTSVCQYGLPGRPCAKTSTLENPVRKIQWGEPSTEFMLTAHLRAFPPQTPPRSSGGSNHRHSGYASSNESPRRRASRKEREREPIRRPTREHKKERIVIVESPPTPRTPPQVYNQVFTAPNSPVPRGRPIIVDERPRLPPRVPSVGAVVGDRPVRRSRSTSRARFGNAWDSPSSSHTSFDLQDRERADARRRRDERISELEAEKRREDFFKAQDEEIRRRPAVPLAPLPLRNRAFLRPSPVVEQVVQGVGGMRLVDAVDADSRRRADDRETALRLRRDADEDEALRQRLRERQMPGRRFSVGPAQRRHRVLYDDGMYRWE